MVSHFNLLFAESYLVYVFLRNLELICVFEEITQMFFIANTCRHVGQYPEQQARAGAPKSNSTANFA